jgi:hypothetical protein
VLPLAPPLLLLLLATVPSPEGLPDEWAGLEFSPAATHAGSMPELSGRRSPARGSLGLGAGLNVLRRGHGRLYWTPLHLELRVSRYGPETIQAAAQMEAGGVLLGDDRLRLELGGAIGWGGLEIASPDVTCDGPCSIGGVGAMFSPVLRLRRTLPAAVPRIEAGLLIRAVIPLRKGTVFFGRILARAVLFTVGLEVAVGPPAP